MPSPDLPIRPMRSHDLTAAVALSAAEGWNQTAQDWARVFNYDPQGCFVAEECDELLGTVTSTCYGSRLAWIGMMLVRSDQRRRGLGRALMTTVLDALRQRNIGCVKLDATPLGEPLYANLGFQREWRFHRWERSAPAPLGLNKSAPNSSGVECKQENRALANHFPMDEEAFGVDRRRWLEMLEQESAVLTSSNGFAMLRPGNRAAYLGPIVANSPAAVRLMVEKLLGGIQGSVFWDVPGPNANAVRLAQELGFHPTRDLTRMWLGANLIAPDLDQQFALAGPAIG